MKTFSLRAPARIARWLVSAALIAFASSCSSDSTGPGEGDNPGTIDPAADATGVLNALTIASASVMDGTAPPSTSGSARPLLFAPAIRFAQISQGGEHVLEVNFADPQGDVTAVIIGVDGATRHARRSIPETQTPGAATTVSIPITFPKSIRPGIVPLRIALADAVNNVSTYLSFDVVIGAPIPGSADAMLVGSWTVVQAVNVPGSIGLTLEMRADKSSVDIDGTTYTWSTAGTRVTFSSGVIYEIVALNRTSLIINEVTQFGRYANLRRKAN